MNNRGNILILASGSPRRRALLRQAGIAIRVVPSRYDEGRPTGDPVRFVRRAALAKAQDVRRRLRKPGWILAADTVVTARGIIFGKPSSRARAGAMLRHLSGSEHLVLTGVSLHNDMERQAYTWVEKTVVRMRTIDDHELKCYLDTGEWKDKAGGYGIQERAGAFVTRLTGCYYNVVGLPLAAVCHRLRCMGFFK